MMDRSDIGGIGASITIPIQTDGDKGTQDRTSFGSDVIYHNHRNSSLVNTTGTTYNRRPNRVTCIRGPRRREYIDNII